MEKCLVIVFDDATYTVDFKHIRKLYLERMGFTENICDKEFKLLEQFFNDDNNVVLWVNRYLAWNDIKEQAGRLEEIAPDYNDEWLFAAKFIKNITH